MTQEQYEILRKNINDYQLKQTDIRTLVRLKEDLTNKGTINGFSIAFTGLESYSFSDARIYSFISDCLSSNAESFIETLTREINDISACFSQETT